MIDTILYAAIGAVAGIAIARFWPPEPPLPPWPRDTYRAEGPEWRCTKTTTTTRTRKKGVG
jgi:hypothetical protein